MEPLSVYGLAAVLASSVGVTLGLSPAIPFKRLSCGSAVLASAVFVIVVFSVGAAAPWMGPIFALVAVVTSVLVSAGVQSDHPSLLTEPYWRRVVLLVFHQRRLRVADTEHGRNEREDAIAK